MESAKCEEIESDEKLALYVTISLTTVDFEIKLSLFSVTMSFLTMTSVNRILVVKPPIDSMVTIQIHRPRYKMMEVDFILFKFSYCYVRQSTKTCSYLGRL